MHRLPLILAAALLAAACVPKKDYEASLAREELLQSHVATVTADRDGQQARADGLEAELEAARARSTQLDGLAESLQARNQTLQAALDDLSGKVADLSAAGRKAREQKADMERMLADVKAEGAEAEAQAAEARARIASLEAEAARLAAEKAKLEQKTAEYDALVNGLQSEIEAGQVTITELSGKLTVQMSNAILFDSGSTEVKATGRDALVKVASVLASVEDREIRVEGHTDDDKVRAGAPYPDNWALSALRARTVLTILTDNGVPPANIAVVGYGEQRPVADNTSPEGKAANRRTEIVLVPRLQAR
jgi:chemotaxis protein MotB